MPGEDSMNDAWTDDQGDQLAGDERRRRLPVIWILLVLDAFLLGGCVAFLVVHELLVRTMNRPASMDAVSEILNVLDHLLPYYAAYTLALLLLLLITVVVWVWWVSKSTVLRYGALVLLFVVVVVAGWVWLSRGMAAPPIPPMTPTPVG